MILQEYKIDMVCWCYLTLFKAWKRMNIAAKETGWEVHNRQEGIRSAYQEKLWAEQGLVRKVSFSCIVYKLRQIWLLLWHGA